MPASRISPLRPSIRLSPAHSRENSRSTSPAHPESIYQKIDPLLANLSPESTLNALTSTEAVPSNEKFSRDVLSQSISQVSPAERALGIRAAVAAQNLNIWYKEVQTWTWPKHADAKEGKGFVPPVEVQSEDNGSASAASTSLFPPGTSDIAYYGCLPSTIVEQYEQRIEEIRDGMDNLNVEELKEHVLSAHIPSRSRPSSSTSTVSVPPPLSYVQLSDFTAVVTATILRALPFLSRLNHLLTTWDVRLLVLRQIPGLLRELKSTRSALNTSFHALRTSDPSENSSSFLSSSQLRVDHAQLESAVVSVGRRMDRVLDALEGRQDSLPESWIDDLEGIESDFAAWVVEVDKYKLRTEWLRAKQQHEKETKASETVAPPVEEKVNTTPTETQSDEALVECLEPESTQECPQMETIEEEPKIEPDLSSESNADEQETSQLTQDSGLSSAESDSTLPPLSEPDTPPTLHTDDEPKHVPQIVSSDCVNEDANTPTPTQSVFPPLPSIESEEDISPTQVPLPVTPSVENKENIPPVGFIQRPAPPSRESSAKPAALSERDTDDDPFTQRPASSRKSDSVAAPDLLVSDDASTESIYQDPPKPVVTEQASSANMTKDKKDVQATETADISLPFVQTAVTAVTTVTEQPEQPVATGTPDRRPKEESSPALTMEKPRVHCAPVRSSPKTTPTRIPVSKMHKPLPKQPQSQVPVNSIEEPLKTAPKPSQHTPQKQAPSKKPLQSPIKLSKIRPAKLDLAKAAPKPRYRRPSTGSVGSLPSNDSSLISSPGALDPNTDSSKDGPLLTPPLSDFPQPPSFPPRGDHALRADRLRHLENRKVSPRTTFKDNRSLSLPLERFINEKMDLQMDRDPVSPAGRVPLKKTSIPRDLPNPSTFPIPQVPARSSSRRPALTRGKSASDLKSSSQAQKEAQKEAQRVVRTSLKSSSLRTIFNQDQPKSLRLRQRLTAHPSLESLGMRRQELDYVEEDVSEPTDVGSRASSPNRQRRKPRDRLDEKVNSILNTLPGRINLVDPNNEADTSSSSSSLDRKMRDRFLSESPPGAPSRSATPAPSFSLMPATRRRSQVFKSEDSCVRLYHLQHAGQTAPTKLFVRTVGEENQRVMVRVGGGWADLGEYLREYVIHHGRRKVSETPRVEVQGLTARSSPGYSTPGSMLTPAAPAYMTSGRATPSRPPSVMSARPASSLNVRKVRRGSNASDAVGTRSVTTSALASFTSPPSASIGRRRLSVSSNYSFGDVNSHSPGNTNSLAPDSHSTPLGLAGPKPRARHVSMSPEGEAWVEDVLQKTRLSSSINAPLSHSALPPTMSLPSSTISVTRLLSALCPRSAVLVTLDLSAQADASY
ncbi:hypothetical protein N7509_013406 [Penicillium cosmopolitanum]|uniref:GAR domain-containing protein n=1 Tax=Penicillium cosmopolitanum TaxID=1131564 RepID=A0A9W9SDS5_9EURO|nr:uncharacterized protein N7509_013406 [Penicillium cosmopolitanum]KAJ5376520.1 hypothetical protein N7509_013406 [Penicillium cosmopolitanum]